MTNEESSATEVIHTVKYQRPKIMLIDLNEEAADTLARSGFHVTVGSLGSPYKVEASNGFVPINTNGSSLPNYSEQEIIVLNMVPPEATLDLQDTEKIVPMKDTFWISCREGLIDPRPIQMSNMKKNPDRIYNHGGVFVVFTDERYSCETVFGHVEQHRGLQTVYDLRYDTWDFLTALKAVEVASDYGEEIKISTGHSAITTLLNSHIKGAKFYCTFNYSYYALEKWEPLAFNKFGSIVAAAIHGQKNGYVFLFPDLLDKPKFLDSFFKEVLPDIAPRLFPDLQGQWTERVEYEMPKVLDYQAQVQQLIEEANKHIEEIEGKIEKERKQHSFLHDLITETDDALVSAVKATLETLGFGSIVDVDKEKEALGDTGPKREDLRIDDKSSVVLIEVKGISNLPKEASSLQVWKYLAPRMRELGHTSVRGLSIINHQRNIPGLERENENPFQEDILINAVDQDFTVATAWDLFRLTRSFIKNNWTHEQIKPLFYLGGRIEPTPSHYEFIGKVEVYFEKISVVGVRIEASEIATSDRIAFDLPVEFEEQDVSSLQLDKEQIMRTEIGMLVGIHTHLTKTQARKGVRVFRVRHDTG